MEVTTNNRYDFIIEEYNEKRAQIIELGNVLSGAGNLPGFEYFINHLKRDNCNVPPLHAFKTQGALDILKMEYWTRVFEETGALNYMSAKKRQEIREMLDDPEKLPEFEEAAIKPTMARLFMDLPTLLAERVDGIFQGLSKSHFTNKPQGFSERMIFQVAHHYTPFVSLYFRNCDVVSDLVAVVRQLNGEPPGQSFGYAWAWDVQRKELFGQWFELIPGIKIRVYKKGTAHLEVSEEIAAKLNQTLALLYPEAVADMRHQRPKARSTKRQFTGGLDSVHLSDKYLAEFADMLQSISTHTNPHNGKTYWTVFKNRDAWSKEVKEVLKLLKPERLDGYSAKFDYPVENALRHIVSGGVVPDYKTHQFYPTPQYITDMAMEMLEYEEGMRVLEPSAGVGNLANRLRPQDVTCIEISPLFCEVLKAKKFGSVINRDFLSFNEREVPFDRVLMNPPFNGGRAKLHVEHAFGQLAYGGRLVAIVPASFKGKELVPGFPHEYSEPMTGFDNTDTQVVIAAISK